MKKELYQQPNTKVLVVRFEDTLLTLSNEGKGGIKNITESGGDVTDDTDGWGY